MPDKAANVMCRDENVSADLRLDVPYETTAAAIAEGRAIAFDEKKKGFSSMCDLRGVLNE